MEVFFKMVSIKSIIIALSRFIWFLIRSNRDWIWIPTEFDLLTEFVSIVLYKYSNDYWHFYWKNSVEVNSNLVEKSISKRECCMFEWLMTDARRVSVYYRLSQLSTVSSINISCSLCILYCLVGFSMMSIIHNTTWQLYIHLWQLHRFPINWHKSSVKQSSGIHL
jgi:hypothetical protein